MLDSQVEPSPRRPVAMGRVGLADQVEGGSQSGKTMTTIEPIHAF